MKLWNLIPFSWRFVIVSIFILSFAFLIGFVQKQARDIKKLKTENVRIENNFVNANQNFSQEKTKNGLLSYSVVSLNLKVSEFEQTQKDLNKKLLNLNLKNKQLSDASEIDFGYRYVDRPLPIKQETDSIFKSEYKDTWLSLNQTIYANIRIQKDTVNNKYSELKKNIFIRLNLDSLKLKDSLLFAHELQYKPFWIFWKKTTGVKLHVQSENPHFQIDRIVDINFDLKKIKQ
jgi:hypothetical protein